MLPQASHIIYACVLRVPQHTHTENGYHIYHNNYHNNVLEYPMNIIYSNIISLQTSMFSL